MPSFGSNARRLAKLHAFSRRPRVIPAALTLLYADHHHRHIIHPAHAHHEVEELKQGVGIRQREAIGVLPVYDPYLWGCPAALNL